MTDDAVIRAAPFSQSGWTWLFLAWLVALVATLGALFIGEVLGQAPCLLCWYQRIAMFPLALILGIACLRDDAGVIPYAATLTGVGSLVALWHTALYVGLVPQSIEPCGIGPSCASAAMTIFGGLPIPMLSVAGFFAIGACLMFASQRSPG